VERFRQLRNLPKQTADSMLHDLFNKEAP